MAEPYNVLKYSGQLRASLAWPPNDRPTMGDHLCRLPYQCLKRLMIETIRETTATRSAMVALVFACPAAVA
jgi:hypothetical protein